MLLVEGLLVDVVDKSLYTDKCRTIAIYWRSMIAVNRYNFARVWVITCTGILSWNYSIWIKTFCLIHEKPCNMEILSCCLVESGTTATSESWRSFKIYLCYSVNTINLKTFSNLKTSSDITSVWWRTLVLRHRFQCILRTKQTIQ